MERCLGSWALALLVGCADRGSTAPRSCVVVDAHFSVAQGAIEALDVLFVIDDSAAMSPRASSLALGGVAEAIVHPAAPGETYDTVQFAVVSADLGTHSAAIAGCTSDGDDGRLNPGTCASTAGALPPFPRFGSDADAQPWSTADFACAADLGAAGCFVQQPLEAAYRALIAHDARELAGNHDPNAGFVRPEALLAVVVLSSRDDASVR